MMLEWYVTLAIGLSVLVALFLLGIPIFVAFIIINATGLLIYFGSASAGMFTSSIVETLVNPALLSIPMFQLMGEVLFRSGAIDRLYHGINQLIVRSRIRLYILSISIASCIGAVSGSALADAAMLSKSVYPGMIQRGYDRRMSIGLILGGATLAPIIPPSIHAVLLATIANISVGKLLAAGIGPGLLIAFVFYLYVKVRVALNPALAPAGDADGEASAGVGNPLLAILPFACIFLLIMGLINFGIATPDEASAVGALGSLLVAWRLRTLTWRLLWQALSGTARTCCMLFMIIASASLFAQLLAFTGATRGMVGVLTNLQMSQWVVYFFMHLMGFIACMFMGPLEFMLIAIPVYNPIIDAFHWNPIWFYSLLLVNLVTGGLTPPFGMTAYVFHASTKEPLQDVFRAALPIVAVIVVCLVILTVFPGLVLFFVR